MAKKAVARLVSENGYEYSVYTSKTGKMTFNKYDPYTRKHVKFVEKKCVKNKK